MRGRVAGLFLLLAGLGGCASLAGPAEYRTVREVPPLALPVGTETRPIKPLFVIPPGPVPTTWPKKFEVPQPKPLAIADAGPGSVAPAAAPAADKPVLTQDGNGYPLLTIAGDFNAIWDRLEESLRGAAVKVDDRDQRVAIYFLRLDDEAGKNLPYQLRLARTQSAHTLTLQKDDDTLAPRETTRSLYEAIVRHWPDSGLLPGPKGPRP
ncbi:MAG: outer membrane protein assembly factor BamC [Pseudomonadota bacterium]